MFALHETTRKYVCRLAFVTLCAAPTLATIAWIGAHFVPGRKGRIAQELSDRLDVHVKLADWREPRPNVVHSAGVTLSDLRSALGLANISGFESRTSGGVQLYRAERASVECSQIAALAARVDGWLNELPPLVHEIRIAALELKLPGALDPSLPGFVLYDVQGRVDRDAAGRVQAWFTANLSPGKTGDPPAIRLTLTPSTDKENSASVVVLETSGAELPTNVLSAVAPNFGALGPAARFRGVVRWTLDAPVRGLLQGNLTGVDLAALLPPGSPHAISGSAKVELQELSWRGPRLERLMAGLRADHAQASQSLLQAMATTLECPRNQNGLRNDGVSSMVPVDLLAVQIQLDEHGLTLTGACPPQGGVPAGCMATSGESPLLMHPQRSGYPLGYLVTALAAPSVSTMPATREAVDMAERLPLSPALSPVRK